jgi:hypothetical protein
MSYVKDLLKMRKVLEDEVSNLLSQFSTRSGKDIIPLDIQYEDSEMDYAVEVNREPHLVLINVEGVVCYAVEPSCIEFEELAEIADELVKEVGDMEGKVTIKCVCGRELIALGNEDEYRGDCVCGRKWLLKELTDALVEISDQQVNKMKSNDR